VNNVEQRYTIIFFILLYSEKNETRSAAAAPKRLLRDIEGLKQPNAHYVLERCLFLTPFNASSLNAFPMMPGAARLDGCAIHVME
jgi:hypothetical protein